MVAAVGVAAVERDWEALEEGPVAVSAAAGIASAAWDMAEVVVLEAVV